MSKPICYFAPDTNIFLHFQSFEEINWKKELDADQAVLVICPIVSRELDRRKFADRDPKIRDRAKKAVSSLMKIRKSGGNVREGVTLKFIGKDPVVDWDAEGLNREVQDDWMIATIMQERENISPLILVTSDIGVQIKAESKEIECHELPDNLLLKPSKSPEEVELEKLRKKVALLENRLPDLKLQFRFEDEYTNYLRFHLEEPTIPAVDDEKLSILKDNLLERVPPPKPPRTKNTTPWVLAGMDLLDSQPEDEIERYKKDIDNYIERLQKYYPERGKYLEEMSRTVQLQFFLRNIGSAPAEDIDIFLYFPDGFEVREKLPAKPAEPSTPVPPRTKMQIWQDNCGFSMPSLSMMNRALTAPSIPNINTGPQRSTKPRIKKTNSYNIRYDWPSLKHGLMMELDPLYITFPSIPEANSFNIFCNIIPANYPEIQSQLHVIIETDNET
ncbi:PIN domain-containing protein [Candidatus Poribacteria bacterium]